VLLSVCLNPAIDVTYRLDTAVVPGRSHRVASVRERAGGKGLNVARVARQLGLPVTVLVLIGLAEPSRRTLAIVDPHDAMLFNESGPRVGPDEWAGLLTRFGEALTGTALVTLSGSLPPGIPPDAYRTMTSLANDRGIPVIVDAEGEPLKLALEAKPFLVKPNLAELRTITSGALDSLAQITAAGREVRRLGARNVVISCGTEGLVAVTEDGEWRVVSPQVVTGNPTGAGDALVATLAAGIIRNDPWPARLRDGVARSAAAVASDLAGEIDLATWASIEPGVVVERLADEPPAPDEPPTPDEPEN
jgi:tagatose 6-phosphate kinase